MSGIALEYDIDLRKFQRRLQRLSHADMTPLLAGIGQHIVDSTLLRFDFEETPDGEPWQKSIRAQLEGGKTLQDRGHLRDSYTYNVISNDAVEAGSNLIYSAIHQYGGTIEAKDASALKFKVGDRWVQKQSIEMPARPALGINSDDENDIDELTKDFIERLLHDH